MRLRALKTVAVVALLLSTSRAYAQQAVKRIEVDHLPLATDFKNSDQPKLVVILSPT